MTTEENAQNKIHDDYFDLDVEIKKCSRFKLSDIFNESTCSEIAKSEVRNKKRIYILYWSAIVCFIVFLMTGLYFLNFTYQPASDIQDKETIRILRRNLSALLTLVFGLLAISTSLIAHRKKSSLPEEDVTHLLIDSPRPTLARLTLKPLLTIVDDKIPVAIIRNGKIQKISLYNVFKEAKRNALRFLITENREILWQDASLKPGRVVIHQDYYNQIFDEYKATLKASSKADRDNRDRRVLKKALLSKQHMQNCVMEFDSPAFWQYDGRRKSKERIYSIDISKHLLKNWEDWEKLRPHARNELRTIAKTKLEHESKAFVEELLKKCNDDLGFLSSFLNGEQRAAATLFRLSHAIEEQDLVSQDTTIQ